MIVSAVFFALLLGAFVFLVLPRGRAWQRPASATVFVLLIALVYGGSIELLGRPKPVRLEWRDMEKAQVLGASMRENDAIYLWLQFDGAPEPKVYTLPWSMHTAQNLQNAMQEGEATGTGVEMTMSVESGLDDREPKFHAVPQPALPDKAYYSGPFASRHDGPG
jgi:uncharacterized SAM-binding protein YcdF (DUF218 family)